jgi:hypothetical protein
MPSAAQPIGTAGKPVYAEGISLVDRSRPNGSCSGEQRVLTGTDPNGTRVRQTPQCQFVAKASSSARRRTDSSSGIVR